MKKLLNLLIALMAISTVFGQGFPVRFADRKSTQLRDVLQKEGTRLASQIVNYSGTASSLTQNQVLSSYYARGQGGSNLYIEKLTLNADRDVTVRFQVNNIGGLANLADAGNTDHDLKAGQDYVITCNCIVPWGAQISFLYRGKMTNTTGNLALTVYQEAYQFTQTSDFFSEYSIMGWGDSIMFGANSSIDNTNPNTSYFLQVVEYYKNQGYRVRPIHKGRYPGATADQLAISSRYGYLDHDDVGLILIGLGMNTSLSDEAYTSSINELINVRNRRYPKTPTIILAPTTRLDASETVLVRYRTILQNIVASQNNPLITYVDMSQSYIGGAAANGVTSGDVHPNQTGHNNMATYLIGHITANNIKLIRFSAWLLLLVRVKRRKTKTRALQTGAFYPLDKAA